MKGNPPVWWSLLLVLLLVRFEEVYAQSGQGMHLGPEERLIEEGTRAPSIAVGPRGHVYVLAAEAVGGPNRTVLFHSTDFGETFQAPALLTPIGGSQLDHIVKADLTGQVTAAWVQSTNLVASFSDDHGATWSPPVSMNPENGRQVILGSASSELDEGSHFYVAFNDTNIVGPTEYGCWFRRSTDGGDSFDNPVSLWFEDPAHEPLVVCDMVMNGEGAVYVAIHHSSSPNSMLFLQTSLDFGATWSGPVPIDPMIQSTLKCASLVVGKEGAVYASWTDRRNGSSDVFFTRSLDQGQTFEPSVRLDTATAPGSSNSFEARMAGDRSGNIYVTWRELGDQRVNVSNNGGSTWNGDTSLGAQTAIFLSEIAANETGHVVVTWLDSPLGIGMNHSRDFGATWLPTAMRQDVDDGGSALEHPVVVDAAGRIYSSWVKEFDGGSTCSLNFRRFVPTLGILLEPLNDEDGFLVVPPEGGQIRIQIELRNHHPTDPITGLTGFLEAEIPSGQTVGPIGTPRTFNIPFDRGRSATFRKSFPGNKPPGLYYVIVTTQDAIEDSVRLPILKR